MFDPFTLALIGGGMGALTSKKPLKGALLGAGMGASGGLLAGAMPAGGMGGLLIPPINPTTVQGASALMGDTSSFVSSGNGLLNGLKQAKPFMDAAGSGMQAAQMFQEPEMPIQPPQLQQQTGGQTLQQLAQAPTFDAAQQAEMRKKRRGLLGGGMA